MLDSNHFWLLVTALGSGVFWLLAYLLIIYRGFKDKSYGMPVVALIGNIAWEFIFGLGIESGCPATWSSCPGTVIQIRNFIWLLFDFVILYTVLKFGRRLLHRPSAALLPAHRPRQHRRGRTAHLQHCCRSSGFAICGVSPSIGQMPEFLPLTLQGGSYYTGFGLNVIMSVLFVFMMMRRNSVEGQSVYIAISKWLGSLAAYGFMLADGIQTPVVNVLYAVVFVFDLSISGRSIRSAV